MAQIIEFGASPVDPPVKPEDGVIKWVHHQTPAAIVRFNRTIQTTAAPRNAKAAQPRKPLLFIHNLKSHRKTGE
ncbi:hypothetical protein NBRC116588_31440 [Pyruvatibacter sp. HU-CL02332]|uniref:hypothetical protein n=1 Tax=Pyruvatibacter sp. HU-CL02332 TaxID=3127650 RepID=UPI0031033C71